MKIITCFPEDVINCPLKDITGALSGRCLTRRYYGIGGKELNGKERSKAEDKSLELSMKINGRHKTLPTRF